MIKAAGEVGTKYKVIAIIGPIGPKKTSIKNRLIELLRTLEAGHKVIYKIDDLSGKLKDIVYILDVKNPKGLSSLRKTGKNILVVWAPVGPKQRKKTLDIKDSVGEDDVVVDGYEDLPSELEVDLFSTLIKTGILGSNLKFCWPAVFPHSLPNIHTNNIRSEDIVKLLDKFIQENKERNIFIIQGGNRYIHDYLSKQYNLNINSVKIASLNKSSLFLALNTLLTSREKVLPLGEGQQRKTLFEFKKLERRARKQIQTNVKSMGFTDVENLLRLGSRGEILKVFAGVNINTPFSRQPDFKKTRKEFSYIDKFLLAEKLSFDKEKIIRNFFSETSFYNKIVENGRNVAFLDDVFYRGRTFYTLSFILSLLGVPQKKWTLYTLCLHRGSKKIDLNGRAIKVFDKNPTYTFENNPLTEAGYWEETANYFKFLDLGLYFNYLDTLVGHQAFAKKINHPIKIWNKITNSLLKKIKYRSLNIRTAEVCLELFIHHNSFNLEFDIDALLGQTAKNCGYCTSFIKYLAEYTSVTDIGQKRRRLKDNIRLFIKRLETSYENNEALFTKAITFYRNNYIFLDYFYLKDYYNEQSENRKEHFSKVLSQPSI